MADVGRTEDAASTATATATAAATTSAEGHPAPERRGLYADSAGATAAEGSGRLTERDRWKIDLQRNALYHDDRERFFDLIQRAATFIQVVAGSTAAASAGDQLPGWAGVAGGIVVAVAGLIDLVYDVGGKARQHNALRRLSYDLLGDCISGRDLIEIEAALARSFGEEPSMNHTVNAVAYNAAMTAYDRPPECHYRISRLRRLFRHFLPWPTGLKTFEELGLSAPAYTRLER